MENYVTLIAINYASRYVNTGEELHRLQGRSGKLTPLGQQLVIPVRLFIGAMPKLQFL